VVLLPLQIVALVGVSVRLGSGATETLRTACTVQAPLVPITV